MALGASDLPKESNLSPVHTMDPAAKSAGNAEDRAEGVTAPGGRILPNSGLEVKWPKVLE